MLRCLKLSERVAAVGRRCLRAHHLDRPYYYRRRVEGTAWAIPPAPTSSVARIRHFSEQQQGGDDRKAGNNTDSAASSGSGNRGSGSKSLVFPWRHTQHLLPRIELEMMRVRGANWKTILALAVWERTTAVFMDYQLANLIGRQWRQDLAENCAWAFVCGLASLFSNIFKVPIDDIFSGDGEDAEINFVYTTPYLKAPTDKHATQEGAPPNGENDDEGKNAVREEAPSNGENRQEDLPEIDMLFESDLFNLYKAFYDKSHALEENAGNPQPMEITLTLKPVDAELWRLMCFPNLSREAVKEDPSWRNDYLNLIQVMRDQGVQVFVQQFWAYADRMLAERGVMQTTIIADVIVDCIETFQVKDLSNSKIVQGDGIEREVRHVVRMELDVSFVAESQDHGRWFKSNWRIADIDDHLDAKGWFPTVVAS